MARLTEGRSACRVLVGKLEGNGPLGRPGRKCKNCEITSYRNRAQWDGPIMFSIERTLGLF